MSRIYERQTDALFLRRLTGDFAFAAAFLGLVGMPPAARIRQVLPQTPHRGDGHRGSIDLEVHLLDGLRLLVENKIDAAYSVTSGGDPQPRRYAASLAALSRQCIPAATVLLAPATYLRATREAASFTRTVAYEALLPTLDGDDHALLAAAINQAETPYEPRPNPDSAAFFAAFEEHVSRFFPALVLKSNPNGGGVRPTGSRTVYFDVARTLRPVAHLPRPRMSLQCRDSAAPSASVKIMLGDLAANASRVVPPQSLAGIGGYLRPAGRSLGIVIDTPQLDTQMPFEAQVPAVEEALDAATRLASWWNDDGQTLLLSLRIES